MDHQAQEQDRDTSDFGFKEIPRAEKSARVAEVFRFWGGSPGPWNLARWTKSEGRFPFSSIQL